MKLNIELDDDAARGYERILETLEEQSGQNIDAEEHAEMVLRQFIGEEYGQLIAQGDPTRPADKR